MRRLHPGKEVTGNIKINLDDDIEEDDEDDDEEEFWFEYKESMAEPVKQKKAKWRKVTLVDANHQQHACRGKLPLLHPWWTVTGRINNGNLKSHPAHSISQHTKSGTYHVMMLLDDCLKDAKPLLHSQRNATKACFEMFCRLNKEAEELSIFNLGSFMHAYIAKEGPENCCLAQNSPIYVDEEKFPDHGTIMKRFVLNSELGATTLLAFSHPHLVQTLSKLLPFAFQGFLLQLQSNQLVNKAAAIAKQLPWEYGFRQIIFRKLKIRGAEAHLSAFEIGDFFPSMLELYKDALHIYEILKVDSRRNGHMYMPFRTLVSYSLFRKLNYVITQERRWYDALKYLQKNEIIVIEQFDQDDNIFLKYNWQAEVDVRACVARISNEYFPMCYDFEFDISSPEFDKIREDSDQLKAIYSIAHFPITVLSGSGGCGKTTVVTTLLKHLCAREAKRLEEEALQKQQQRVESDKNLQTEELFRDQADGTTTGECPNLLGTDNSTNDEILTARSPISVKEERASTSFCDITSQNSCDEIKKEGTLSSSQSAMENVEGGSPVDEDGDKNLMEALISDLIKILKEGKETDSPEMATFKGRFLLTAPTGKAARLLGCKASLPSATIHSVICSWKLSETNWKYDDVQVLVVDECSLVSVRLFASLLNILTRHSSLRKIILLGDIKQLPSIEPGDFLRDIFKSMALPGLSLELTNNHRSESALIVENSKKISRRHMPAFDSKKQFHLIEIQENGGDCDRDETIRNLLKTKPEMKCHIGSQFVAYRKFSCAAINELCCKHYNGHSILKNGLKGKEVYDFRPGDKISLGKNNEVLNNIDFLTSYIAEHEYFKENYLSSKTKKNLGKSQAEGNVNTSRTHLTASEASSLFLGEEEELDKTVAEMKEKSEILLMEQKERTKRDVKTSQDCRSQRADDDYGSKTDSEKKPSYTALPFKSVEKLCNGEIYFIMDEKTVIKEDGIAVKYFILSDRDPELPKVVCASEEALRKKCLMRHSWARTIHTYQGSESQTVIYVVGAAKPQNWQHVYTAVTRGKKAVYIVGKATQLQIAVACQNERRRSRLYHRMKDMILEGPSPDTFDVFKRNVSEHMSLGSESCLGFHATSIFHTDPDDLLMCSLDDPTLDMILNGEESTPNGEIKEQVAGGVNETKNFHYGEAAANEHISSNSLLSPASSTSHVRSTSPVPKSSQIFSSFSPPCQAPNSTKEGSLSDKDLFHSPSKQQRLREASPVDTPFHSSFSGSLSISDTREEEDENPLPERKSAVRRKLNPL